VAARSILDSLKVLLLALAVAAAGVVAPARADQSEARIPSADPQEVRCMALNIYWEADHGSDLDLRAVAHVTVNRTSDPSFPSDVCGVVMQGGEKPLYKCQFQWWCDGRSDQPTNQALWQRAMTVAQKVMTGQDSDPTFGALYFHDTRVKPGWTATLQRTVTIGDHVYYR
jgi:spore germination cell wall hydrolase CwlJ-like protein